MIDLRNSNQLLNTWLPASGALSGPKALPLDPEPFTTSWYSEHPNAWHSLPTDSDVWATPTQTETAKWLGWSTTASSTVTTGTAVSQPADSTTSSVKAVSESAKSEQVINDKQGNATTAHGSSDANSWMPLGVYMLAPAGQDEAHLIVQLAVDKQGKLAGNYYDVLSDQANFLQGVLESTSQKGTFHIGEKERATFETSLAELTSEVTPLLVKYGDGHSQSWLMVRIQTKTSRPQ
ncbi:MAG TPA: hypothetical protein VMJ32_03875 [Pirellulales bacterium]|nr:hypothetical protein [Pirellulales bacterium]